MTAKMIGVVGGVGSYAGIDLIRKIYDHTDAASDQEHLPVSLLSVPHSIVDRTDFILGKTTVNPGIAIAEVISKLTAMGAEVIGIPCNTAHASMIYDVIAANTVSSCKLIHMVGEVADYLKNSHSYVRRVGILGTTGTISVGVYTHLLSQYNIEVIYPSEDIQNLFVHSAIYDVAYGIKSCSNPVSTKAKNNLSMAASFLSREGAEAIVMACTEIPLALTENAIEKIPLIDATTILAKALIRESLSKNSLPNKTPVVNDIDTVTA